jgi:hypothetical protein
MRHKMKNRFGVFDKDEIHILQESMIKYSTDKLKIITMNKLQKLFDEINEIPAIEINNN